MNKNNLLINNFIPFKYLKKNLQYKLLKDYNKIFKEITTNINNPNKIFNILSKEYKFNFKRNDLQKFKKFENIVIIGMGGSILG